MQEVFLMAIIIAVWLAFESQNLDKVVSPRLIERDMNGVNTLFILSLALLAFGVSGWGGLYFKLVDSGAESLVIGLYFAALVLFAFGVCYRGEKLFVSRC